MRQTALTVAFVAGCIVVSVAGAAPPPQAVTSPGPVTALGFDNPYVAFAASPSPSACQRVYLWNRSTGKTVRIGGRQHCEPTSTGSGILRVSIARTRVLWLYYTGGNIREWWLYTATPTRPQPRQLEFLTGEPEDPSPILVGDADASRYGDYLPYAAGNTVVVLTASGRRAHTYRAPARVTAVSAAWGAVGIALADGRVLALDSADDWRESSQWTGSPAATAVFVTGNGVAAQRGRIVEFRKGDGSLMRWTIPADGALRDASGLRAVYTTRGRVKLLDLSNGTTRDLGPGRDARLEALTAVLASGRTLRLMRIT